MRWSQRGDLRLQDYSVLSGWAQRNHKDPYKGKAEAGESKSEKEIWQWKQTWERKRQRDRDRDRFEDVVAGFADGEVGWESRSAESL